MQKILIYGFLSKQLTDKDVEQLVKIDKKILQILIWLNPLLELKYIMLETIEEKMSKMESNSQIKEG